MGKSRLLALETVTPTRTTWSIGLQQGGIPELSIGVPMTIRIETLRAGVLAGIGIGLFTRIVLADELRLAQLTTVLDRFMRETRDISLIWPRRRFVPARVRRPTEFFAAALLPLLDAGSIRGRK